MKRIIFSLLAFAISLSPLFSQPSRVLFGNNRPQTITIGGIDNLLNTIGLPAGVFYDPNLLSMKLWLGGVDNAGNIRTSVTSRQNNNFIAGPLSNSDWDSILIAKNNFSKIWRMTALEIATMQADFKDGKLDAEYPNIMAWPARNNPYFLDFNGFELPKNRDFAPFKDTDNDGIYNPQKGDFPIVEGIDDSQLPAVFLWNIYNDFDGSSLSRLGVEVQQTAFVYDCPKDSILHNTMFISYKIINKNAFAIDSVFAGLLSDNQFNCQDKFAVGCSPENNSFWAYQNLNFGDTCKSNIGVYQKKLPTPAISYTFLNQPITSYIALGNSPPDWIAPITMPYYNFEIYRVLNGLWKTGEKITKGGIGYSKDNALPTTSFMFSDNPNKPNGWSLQQNTNLAMFPRSGMGAVSLKKILPNEARRLDIAISYHLDTSFRKILEVTDLMYKNIPKLQNAYNQKIALKNCFDLDSCLAQNCVYPGDLNHDGIANIYDQIDFHSFKTTQGKTRKGNSYWIGQNATNWGVNQLNGNDLKHGDADGNGKIDNLDLQVIQNNYGNTTPFYIKPDDVLTKGNDIEFIALSNNFDTIALHDFVVSYKLEIRKKNISNLKAIAFQLDYDRRFFDKIKFEMPPAFEKTAGLMQEVDYYSIAMGSKIASIQLKCNEDYIAKYLLPTTCTSIRIKNIKAVLQDGTILTNLGAKNLNICFDKNYVNSNEIKIENSIHIFPNPVGNFFRIDNASTSDVDYHVFNTQGVLLKHGSVKMQSQITVLSDDLQNGLYFIQIRSEGKEISCKKILKILD